jgi:hypothetical protein
VTDTVERIYQFGIPYGDLPSYRHKPLLNETEETEVSPVLNVDLLNEIMDYVREHPQQWRQSSWYKLVNRETGDTVWEVDEEVVEEVNSCGAAFCFAGHVALREGFPKPPTVDGSDWTRYIKTGDGAWDYDEEYVDEFARKRLGLNTAQADILFSGENQMHDLENLITALKVTNGEVNYYTLIDIRDEFDYVASVNEITNHIAKFEDSNV